MSRRLTIHSLPKDPDRYLHGRRARYVLGCRCALCREANRIYNRWRAREQNAGRRNDLVPAAAARAHMQTLSRRGIGRRAVQTACGIGDTTLQQIKNGGKTQIRRQTAERILAVGLDARRPHAAVPAQWTYIKINQLLKEGWTKTALAQALGSRAKVPALQLSQPMVLKRSADKVDEIYRQHGERKKSQAH